MTTTSPRQSARFAAVICAVLAASLISLPGTASAATSAPAFVRTIGVTGQSEMYPSGLDVDTAGNVVVADTGNDRVSFYPAGSTTPSWIVGVRGNAVGANPTGFQNPRDVAVDAARVYVADSDNNVVQVLDKTNGAFITKINYPMVTPIGVSVGNAANGDKLILVSNGGNGKVYVFDASLAFVRALNPVTTNSGTRDAATDSDGNTYVADYRGDQIVKYGPTGNVITRFGGGAGAPVCQQITRPYGVDVDDQDHVYVASSTVGTIKEFTAGGACEATFGERGTGPNQLLQLRRVAVGAGTSPTVYGADLWGVKILSYDQNGSLGMKLGTGTYPAAGGLNEPHGLTVSGQYVYVTDTVNQRIQRFNLNGSSPIMWGNKGVSEESASFNWAQGIGFNSESGNVWVANTRNNRLDEFGPDGGATALRRVGRRVGGSPNFYWPMDIAFTNTGKMFVADTFNNRIQAFSVTPTSVTHLWSAGTLGTGTGNLSRPFALAFDGTGATPRVLVADTRNSRIVAFNATTGAWMGVLPITKGSALGKIASPRGIAVDAATGAIWISDSGNNRIQKFNNDGTYAEVAVGSKGSGANQFNFPQRIKVVDGLVYVADAFNSRIQVYQA